MPQPSRRSRSLPALLVLASLTLITLDVRGGADSPVEPLRAGAGAAFGPLERGAAAVVAPLAALPELLTTTRALREEVARLEAENGRLAGEVATAALDRRRAAQLDGLLARSRRSGHALVAARVVALGPAQSFSRTVTIDAGTSSGVRPDQTVVNHQGLVGRVLRADRTTATVLLLADRESVVGGRLGSSLEIGFLRGRGAVGEQARLALDLVDLAAAPVPGDVVVTWGSRGGAPYVPGVPIGTVREVSSSPRQLSRQALVEPFVDFTALDVVGVVVDPATRGDRPVIRAGRGGAR